MRKKTFTFLLIGISFLVLTFFVPSISEAQAPPSVSLSADPVSVPSGGSTALSWWTNAWDYCEASGGWSGAKSLPLGSETISNIFSETTFTLTCYNVMTPGSDSVTVTISGPTCPPPPDCTCRWDCVAGEAGTLDTCADDRLVCCCPVNPPTVNFWADSTDIDSGEATTLNWSSENADGCVAFDGPWSGVKGTEGNESTGPLISTQTYVIRCTGAGGPAAEANVTINVGALPVGTVVLFENTDYDYAGDSESLSSNDNNLTNNPSPSCTFGNWNDCALSIRVSSGYVAILHEDIGFGGADYCAASDISNLGNIGWNNRVSSIEIVSAPCPVAPPPGGGNGFSIVNPLSAESLEELVENLIDFIFKIALVLAPLMIIIAGFLLVTAGGSIEQVTKARRIILWTVIGFLIVLLAKGIVAIIKGLLGAGG